MTYHNFRSKFNYIYQQTCKAEVIVKEADLISGNINL